MNKQQLANKIWESINKIHSKIEANEYKEYILGFIFYKYLSDKEVKVLKEKNYGQIKSLTNKDKEIIEYLQNNIGYFIAYKDLFSTWIEMGTSLDVSNVKDALVAFNNSISKPYRRVFNGIFDMLQSKIYKNSSSQTKTIIELLQIIKDIPTDKKQGYDILGFIYEYLINMFAANSGKKAGEFYTPYEVSIIISEIIVNHLKNKKEISVYDPTSGSGSLLISMGQSVSKHLNNNNVKYFAQELKENTYNLTKMNLIMHDVKPENIIAYNGDVLEKDLLYSDENIPIYVDAIVSNPPYSQAWDPKNKLNDPRYKDFKLAPSSKADYAFLLHNLYHIKSDGIVAIILPQGVLFRSNTESEIRKKLIENNYIDTIISLPKNIFSNTEIPTIIMILKRKRNNTDIFMVDASKCFIKDGKKNKIRSSDIKRIIDAVIARKNIKGYSKVIDIETIRNNEYNLNIPRYIDSFEKTETLDIYASIFGGIPKAEIEELNNYWLVFPNLKNDLFTNSDTPFVELVAKDIRLTIQEHSDVKQFKDNFRSILESFSLYLKKELIDKMAEVNIYKEEDILNESLFEHIKAIPLIDKYEAYQILDDEWLKIVDDLEVIQIESLEVDKKIVLKWIENLINNLNKLPDLIINKLIVDIQTLYNKYKTSYVELMEESKKTSEELCSMISQLVGNESDIMGINAFKLALEQEYNLI